jgi:hypothetical protein
MELRLPFPPAPEFMADHASHLVRAAETIEGERLDYEIASLGTVDRILGRFHDDHQDSRLIAETLFLFGAYIGEVIVRQADGSWIAPASHEPMGGGWPVVRLDRGGIVNPIGKAFKRVEYGPGDSITYFYDALVRSPDGLAR